MNKDKFNQNRICPTCGGARELIREISCARCDVPQIINIIYVDFEQACRHIDAKHFGTNTADRRPERDIITDAFKDWSNTRDEIRYLPIVPAARTHLLDFEPPERLYLEYLIEAFDLDNHLTMNWKVLWR